MTTSLRVTYLNDYGWLSMMVNRVQNTPMEFSAMIQRKIVNMELTVLIASISPASSPSPPMLWLIGKMAFASGVAYSENRMKSSMPRKPRKMARLSMMVGTMMSSVTDIVNIISYVLIAFVAISLVVSSIMIGVITYISVMERRKEIGILRAIGASKRNVSQVFNAETFIIGLLAGAIGIAVTLLLLLPGNAILHSLTGQQNISASLPPLAGLILIALSTALTMLGDLIPSRSAAKCNHVTALRAE